MDELSNFNARIEVEVRLRRAAYDRIAELEAQVEQLRLRNQTPRARDEYFLGRIKELEARNQTMTEALERYWPEEIARAALSEPAEDVLPNPGHIDAAGIEVTKPEEKYGDFRDDPSQGWLGP